MEKPDREKYIGILSRAAKVVKEFSEDTPIIFGLEFVEDLLRLLEEQETEKKCCRDCEYYGACHDE